MKYISFFIILSAICACCPQQRAVNVQQIDAEEKVGNFAKASHLIDLYIAENNLPEDSVYELHWRKDKMRRIALDFNQDKASVIDYVREYYPDVNDEMLSRWEAVKSLECMTINGEKKYFSRAAANLFRIDTAAKARKLELKGVTVDKKEEVLKIHLPEIVSTLIRNGRTQTAPIGFRVKYSVTLKANAVPEGEVIRCWLPYPREDNRRQSAVKTISVNDSNYLISPSQYAHRTLYMEKTTKKDEPLTFAYEFSYQSAAEWFNLEERNLLSYDTNSDLYKIYTAERPPHILFSDSIRAISARVVGDETNLYRKVKKIFTWIDELFPWAGAREYATLDHIPAYVLENGHGDCGQVTLLFLALARYNGIPARWQSGFETHPNGVNLHDWGEFYMEGIGWIPVDESFGVQRFSTDDSIRLFYSNGIDAYRWIVNDDYSRPLFPQKIYPRSDNVDFQRGELEWKGGNIYYDQWNWDIDVVYL